MLKGVDMVLYESVRALGMSAVLDSVSRKNLTSFGTLETLEGLSWQSEQTTTSKRENALSKSRLKAIDVQDLGNGEDYWDDDKAKDGVGHHYGYSAEALQASPSEDDDSDYEQAPLGVREMKGRVNDRELEIPPVEHYTLARLDDMITNTNFRSDSQAHLSRPYYLTKV